MVGKGCKMCVGGYNIHLMFVSKSMHEKMYTHLMQSIFIDKSTQLSSLLYVYWQIHKV